MKKINIEHKANIIFNSRIVKRIWGPGDEYLVVPLFEHQVFKDDGFQAGDAVEIHLSIKKIIK